MVRYDDKGIRVIQTHEEQMHMRLTEEFYMRACAEDSFNDGDKRVMQQAARSAQEFIDWYFKKPV